MTVEYAIFEDEELLFICADEDLAEEMVLALTEEYAYHGFLQQCDKVGIDLAIWAFRNAKTYGWHKYQIKRVRRIVN